MFDLLCVESSRLLEKTQYRISISQWFDIVVWHGLIRGEVGAHVVALEIDEGTFVAH